MTQLDVPVETLDDFVERNNIRRVDLVKIDTELQKSRY